MTRTRNERKHSGIRAVHRKSYDRFRPELVRGEKRIKSAVQAQKLKELADPLNVVLTEYIRKYSVLDFVVGCFMGNIVTPKRIVTRADALGLLDKNKSFRGFVSHCWRDEDAHNHEWVPCTYISEIITRALRAENFKYIVLANQMRTLTKNILFKPITDNSIVAMAAGRLRTTYALLQAHPGGLRLGLPDTRPLGTVGGSLRNGSAMLQGSIEFHDAIIAALKRPGTPEEMVSALRGVYVAWCWDGNLTHVGAPAAVDAIWPFYTFGDGTAYQVWAPGPAPALPLASAQSLYNGVLAQFTAWDGIARAPRRANDYSL